MQKCILLLRGINVGGKNILPMKELVRDLQSLNLENIKTYIQSGNIIFQSKGKVLPTLADKISSTIEDHHGFRPHTLLLSAEEFQNAIESNPFPEAKSEPKTLHLFFLASPSPEPDMESINRIKLPSEQFRLTNHVFYLHAPDGIGRSKLAGNVEKFLKVAVTARNWRTVQKLWEMAKEV